MPDKLDTALIPPKGDKNVGKRVYQVLGAVIADKISLGLPDTYNRNYKLRRNRHWKQKTSAQVPLISANLIYTHIQRSTNTLTDNNPAFNVSSRFAMDDEGQAKNMAMDLQRIADDWWQDTEQQAKFEKSVINGEMYAIAIEKVVFNEKKAGGLGEAETRIVDPMFFGWYPVKLTDLDELQGREAVLEFWVDSCRNLKKKYPQFADKIKSDTDIIKEMGDERREIAGGSNSPKANNLLLVVQSVIKQVTSYFRASQDITDIDNEETVVCEMWVRDDETKYTGGIRYLLVCSGGEVVLEDKDNPNISPTLPEEQARQTYLFDRFPYGAANSVTDTSNAWGISDIEQIDQLNQELNKSLSQLTLEKDKSARKKLINPLDSGVENSEFTSYPAIIRPNNALVAAGIKYLENPPPSVDIEKSIQLFKELILLIAGTFDLDQAQTQSNVIAYKAIAALLERAATMMRGKIRNYSHLLRERGRMFISHVQNFYTEDRWLSFKDEQGLPSGKMFKGSDMARPVNLTVVNGSTLPISRIQSREESVGLFDKQAIDQEELLERLEYPNRDKIIKRMQAGPLGSMFDQLGKVGMPPEILEYIKGIAEADPKKLQKALESGEYPTFDKVMTQLIQENMPEAEAAAAQPAPVDPEMIKAQAQAQKLEAETALTMAKTQTEAVNQEVALAGVQFDEAAMKIKRAETVHNMESNIKDHNKEDTKVAADMVSNLTNKPGWNEKGIQSNNK